MSIDIQCVYIGRMCMSLFSPSAARFADLVGRISRANPFLPEYLELICQALGPDFEPAGAMYYQAGEAPGLDHEHPNLSRLDQRSNELASLICEQLREGVAASDAELL